MSIQSEINRINSNVQSALNAVADTGVSVPEGANSDNLPVAVSALANEKQDKLTGAQGQIVGFGPDGLAVAQYAPKPKFVSVILPASGWDSSAKTQAVTVTGVSATETAQMITPTPALASQTAYYEAGILCTGQTANSLTFTATTVPADDLTVYVVIQEVAQG